MISAGPAPTGQFEPAPISDINVTPLVDVMLVLLIIFMITAPLAVAGVNVNLPQNKAKHVVSDQKPIEISIKANRQIYVGASAVDQAGFGVMLQQLAQASGDPATARVFVRADQTLDYGYVMQVVSQVAAAGFVKVAFLTDPRPGVAR